MITIEELELFEDNIIDRVKLFTRNHPFITTKLVMLFGIISMFCAFIVMYWAAVGIGFAEDHYQTEVAVGNITSEYYDSIGWIFNTSEWIYNFAMVIIEIIFVSIIILTIYLLIKLVIKSRNNH